MAFMPGIKTLLEMQNVRKIISLQVISQHALNTKEYTLF